MASPDVHTYHCLCAELLLATFAPLKTLPVRKSDSSSICKVSTSSTLPLPGAVVLSGSTVEDAAPTVLKLEDGFEKRYGVACRRCGVRVAYWLDWSQFEEGKEGVRGDVLYVLLGGLKSTAEMKGERKGQREESG